MKLFYFIVFVSIALSVHSQTTIMITPDKDNSIYSESGSLSNALGINLFAGVTTSGNIRRSLVHFNLSEIPTGAVITAVTLTLTCNNVSPASPTAGINIHKLLSDWGEVGSVNNPNGTGSAATTNDATWTHRFFNATTWTTAGGDFNSTSSASIVIPATGQVNISSAEIIQDVQSWVDNASNNFGWALLGNTESGLGNARRFASRDNTDENARPKLSITYTGNLPVTLQNFAAINQPQSILLRWITKSELNNSHFNIEHSVNGQLFFTIGSVKGGGSSTIEKKYSFLHEYPASGTNYYRLAQVDVDGNIKYSPIVTAVKNSVSRLKLLPNPVTHSVSIKNNSDVLGNPYVIKNSVGMVVRKGIVTPAPINLSQIPVGVYYISIFTLDQKNITEAFVKK